MFVIWLYINVLLENLFHMDTSPLHKRARRLCKWPLRMEELTRGLGFYSLIRKVVPFSRTM